MPSIFKVSLNGEVSMTNPWKDGECKKRQLRRALRRQHLESYILEALDWGRVLKARKAEEDKQSASKRKRRKRRG